MKLRWLLVCLVIVTGVCGSSTVMSTLPVDGGAASALVRWVRDSLWGLATPYATAA